MPAVATRNQAGPGASSPTPEPAIRAEDLTRYFGTVRAVDHVTFDVPAGSLFGFLGPNGAGKSTTIRLLLGLADPTSGRAEVLGLDSRWQADAVRARAGALLDYPGLYDRLTAEDNLDFYGCVWHLPTSERRARIRELLTHFGLWERRKESPELWSTGMRQKLAVARALLHRPSVLFLDEPTSGLDPVAAIALGDDLAVLAAREGVTVFLTTHNLAEAERLCDRIGILSGGRLVAVGSLDDIRGGAGGPYVEVTGRGISDAALDLVRTQTEVSTAVRRGERLVIRLRKGARTAPLVALLVRLGAEVEEVHKRQPSLQDAYLALVGAEA